MPENENLENKKTVDSNKIYIVAVVGIFSILSSFLSFYLIKNEIKNSIAKDIEKNESKNKKEEIQSFYKIGEFLVNLANKEQSRYVKTDISIEYMGNKETEKEIKIKESVYRDKIINILSSYTSQDLNNKNGKEKLKEEILREIKDINPKVKILNIYFNTFIMQ